MDQLDFLKIIGATQEPLLQGEQAIPVDPMMSVMLQAQKERKPKQAVAMPVPSNGPAAPEYMRQGIVASHILSPEEEAVNRDYRDRFKQLINSQLAKADEMRELTRSTMEADAGKIDWTPAASLIKAFGGPDITAAAQAAAPMSTEKKIQMRTLLEKASTDPETRALSEVGEILKGFQGGKFALESAREKTKTDRQLLNQQKSAETEMSKWIDKEVVEPWTEKTAQFNEMKRNIASGDYGSIMSTLSMIARNVADNKGSLSDNDIIRYADSTLPGGIAKLQAYLSGEAQITPEYQERLRRFVSGVESETKKGLKKRVELKKKTYSQLPTYKNAWEGGGSAVFDSVEKDLLNLQESTPQESYGNEFDAWKKSKGL